jgi:hypothetical protein
MLRNLDESMSAQSGSLSHMMHVAGMWLPADRHVATLSAAARALPQRTRLLLIPHLLLALLRLLKKRSSTKKRMKWRVAR